LSPMLYLINLALKQTSIKIVQGQIKPISHSDEVQQKGRLLIKKGYSPCYR